MPAYIIMIVTVHLHWIFFRLHQNGVLQLFSQKWLCLFMFDHVRPNLSLVWQFVRHIQKTIIVSGLMFGLSSICIIWIAAYFGGGVSNIGTPKSFLQCDKKYRKYYYYYNASAPTVHSIPLSVISYQYVCLCLANTSAYRGRCTPQGVTLANKAIYACGS